MNQNDKINFNFTYFALKTLGNNLYSNPWSAISELVANGLDAGANDIKILIDLGDKEHATIEILDNGCGMTYDDLVEKYAIIGRNKRETEANEKVLGRKGVGKLATLYLTSHFYIATKTLQEDSIWEVNTAKYKDSDIPGLEAVRTPVQFICEKEWQAFNTGTAIKLLNVNLKAVGEQRIKSLKAILSDYYSDENIDRKISVAITENGCAPNFETLEKKVYFNTLYALFDNTKKHLAQMSEAVYLTGEDDVYPEVDYPRKTIILEDSQFHTSGDLEMKNLDGKIINVPYRMVGWIGVNCSLKDEIQRRNAPDYKKFVYRNNELKLYVRGKLAVADMMRYIGSTHAISNYIEGEISFDVLDRDDLEDIATSNREGYKMDDPRVQQLIKILKPIVTRLISERAAIGSLIKEQNDNITKAKELEVKNAVEGREQIKKALEVLSEEKKAVERKNDIANKRLFVLERNFIGDGENYKNGMHLAVNYAKAIKSNAIKLSRVIEKKNLVHLIDIAGYAENIIRLNKMLGKAKFCLDSPEITENLFDFIKDYLKIIGTSSLTCECDFQVSDYTVEFDFCEMSMALENIVSNSKKAKANKLLIKNYYKDGFTYLEFNDNGKGLDKNISDYKDIFKLGFTTTGGYGIGCYYIKKVFSKIANRITIESKNGFSIILELK